MNPLIQGFLARALSLQNPWVDDGPGWIVMSARSLETAGDMLVGGMENSQDDSHVRPGPDLHDNPPFSVMNIGRPYYKPLGDQVLLDVQGQSYIDSIGAVYMCESLAPDP